MKFNLTRNQIYVIEKLTNVDGSIYTFLDLDTMDNAFDFLFKIHANGRCTDRERNTIICPLLEKFQALKGNKLTFVHDW